MNNKQFAHLTAIVNVLHTIDFGLVLLNQDLHEGKTSIALKHIDSNEYIELTYYYNMGEK